MGNFVFSLTVTILAKDLGASAMPRYRNHLSGAQLCRGKENAPKLRPLSFLGVVYSGKPMFQLGLFPFRFSRPLTSATSATAQQGF